MFQKDGTFNIVLRYSMLDTKHTTNKQWSKVPSEEQTEKSQYQNRQSSQDRVKTTDQQFLDFAVCKIAKDFYNILTTRIDEHWHHQLRQ